jgi:UPF0716 family protein affecting phage T7 exclusion
MKYIIIIILVGISEITLIGELHDLIGLKEMLLVYTSTTIIGAYILYLYSSKAKRAMKASKKIGKKLQKKTKKSSYIPTHDELEKIRPSIYIGIYIIAVALVVIPGILTDIIGMTIVIPFINKWLINREINKYIMNSEAKNA